MINSNGVLLVFAREPVPGETKTRLVPMLGEKGAADLHKKLLLNTLRISEESQFKNIELWGTSSSTSLNEYTQKFNIQFYQQKGHDLGERMYHAMSSALKRHKFAVLIGSDIPMLGSEQLDYAYQKLEQGIDAVLGPTEDGGYYLIGLRRSDISLFKNIAWGSNDVANQTRIKIDAAGWQWEELDVLWDIDTPDDYRKLQSSEYSFITN